MSAMNTVTHVKILPGQKRSEFLSLVAIEVSNLFFCCLGISLHEAVLADCSEESQADIVWWCECSNSGNR